MYDPYWNRNGTFDSYLLVFVLFIIYVGCRKDVPDHTSWGFVMYIVLYSGVVGTVDFLNKLYSFYASVA